MGALDQTKSRFIIRLAFFLGLSSILSQILLLRELVTVFYGNETAYAIILASWLFWVAVGSFLISRLKAVTRNPQKVMMAFHYLIFLVLPLSIMIARSLKVILGVQTGEMIGLVPMGLSTFALLAPLAMILGGMYSLICHLSNQWQIETETAKGVSSVYLWESVGSSVAGLLFSFFLVKVVGALYLALCLGALNLLMIVLFKLTKNRVIFTVTGLVFISVISALILKGPIAYIDDISRKIQWKDFEVVDVADSIYGNLALVKLGGQFSLFENGLLSFTTKDDYSSEEVVHLPLSAHPDPKKILLIGNGMGGAVKELLKYPKVKLDYVELDPEIFQISWKHLPAEYKKPFLDSRINFHYMDARLFVKQTGRKGNYDVILVNLSDPYTALINRYYTVEFFKEAKAAMSTTGIISLRVSSSENYLDEETREFLRSLNSTLRGVFADVVSIPGDTHIFLASNRLQVLSADPQDYIRRLKLRNIATTYIREYYLPFRMSPERMAGINEILSQKGSINTDTRPIAYLFDIITWSGHFDPVIKKIYAGLRWMELKHILFFPLVLLLAGWAFVKKYPTLPVTASIMTTGFSEIIFQVVVILAFQTLYGYAYYKIGLIIASFMLGLVLGSYKGKRLVVRPQEEIVRFYRWTQFTICIYPLLLPVLFVVFRDAAAIQRHAGLFAGLFAMLPIVAGFIGGIQYPLAIQILLVARGNSTKSARIAGFIYATDVFGAMIGAILTGAFFIPLLGINAICVFCAALNSSVLILLLIARR